MKVRFISILVVCLLVGCSGDEYDDWVGTWTVEAHGATLQEIPPFHWPTSDPETRVSYDSIEWTFLQDGTWYLITIVRLEFVRYNLADMVQGVEVTGTINDSYTIIVDKVHNPERVLRGTWSRRGNRLTLTENHSITLLRISQ